MSNNSTPRTSPAYTDVDLWNMKNILQKLQMARGKGTSMISLIIPPKEQISKSLKMLIEEHGTAMRIKSSANRHSVLGALMSAQQKLKLYTKVPPNGLAIYCGTIVNEEGKEKKMNIDFEPIKPINTSLYRCDNKFHTEALIELLADEEKYGFIIIDGNGALFGILQGNMRKVVHKFNVDLPRKHGRGGQSSARFERLRIEKRQHYIRKVCERAALSFISSDKVFIRGLVVAGAGDLKTDLLKSELFDPRINAKVINILPLAYGGLKGFHQAIDLAVDSLKNVKYMQEKELLDKYFSHIAKDTGKYCFGVEDTLQALKQGAVDTLICSESLDATRYVLKSHTTNQEEVVHLTAEQVKQQTHFFEKETGKELDLLDSQPLVEWLAANYKSVGATLVIITNSSKEGNQFKRGFGGIGALLRYKMDFQLTQLDDQPVADLYSIDEY